MSFCGCAAPVAHAHYPVAPAFGAFPLIVVLFILLIIIGCGCCLR